MLTDIERDSAARSADDLPSRLPRLMLPLLTTWCLASAAALQFLGLSVPVLGSLSLLGLVLATIGLGAYACVRSGRIENGWAFLGLVPVAGLVIGYAVLRFRQPQPNAPLHALKGAVHAGMLGVMLVAAGGLFYDFTQSGREIRGEIPDDFPILAVVPDGPSFAAHIVPKRRLEAFVSDHPDISFLVPKKLEEVLHANLEDAADDLFRPGYFKVTEISPYRQAFEVRYPIHDEAYSVGWYEATAQSIEPKRYLFFHDMMLGFFLLPALVVGGMVYSLLSRLLDRMLWPRFE